MLSPTSESSHSSQESKHPIFYCRFQCKTFGKNFKPSGSFYSSVSTTCQNSKLWSVTTIPDPCVWSHCVDPPPPPSASKLELSWDSTDPPAHDETVWYRCKAGNKYNRLETDFSKTGYALTCLTDNKFSSPSWPVCIDSNVQHSSGQRDNSSYLQSLSVLIPLLSSPTPSLPLRHSQQTWTMILKSGQSSP